ncbi:MAG: hypothetical protein LLG04_13055 [Parachlamydia sp.]|nr:hypothetical protein [Parachlamydia sp.]
MQQQQTNFQTLICSLNTSELQTLILQLSESDASLSDRIVELVRHLFPRVGVPNAPQWDPKEILAQAHRILNPRGKHRSEYYEMEAAGDLYDDLLSSLQGMFCASSKDQVILILQGLTQLVAENLDEIMSGCDEGLPWQGVGEQLGKYWFQLASSNDLLDSDRNFLLSFLSKCIPQLASYGLDCPLYPALNALQKKGSK